MSHISGPQGSSSGSTGSYHARQETFDRTIWERAMGRIFEAYMDSDDHPATLEGVQLLIQPDSAPEQQAADHRVNQLIQGLWNQASGRPGGSQESVIEAVYYTAVEQFTDRFQVPPMGEPSFSLQQAWLLSKVNEQDSAAAPSLEKLASKLPEGAAERLRELCADPSATPELRRRFLQMVQDLLDQSVSLDGLLDQPAVKQAIEAAAPRHTRLLLEKMDREVQKVLRDLKQKEVPGGITDAEIEAYRKNWTTLLEQVQSNAPFKTTGQNLTVAGRAAVYDLYLTRLAGAWAHFQGEEPWRVFDTLPLFLQDCETGWDRQIGQLINQIPGGIPVALRPLVEARDERRGQVVSGLSASALGANVHYEAALRQQLNQPLALGYSESELGVPERDGTQQIVQPTAEEIRRSVNRRPEHAQELVKRAWQSLPESDRDEVRTFLRNQFQAALDQGLRPFFLPVEDLARIQRYQRDLTTELDAVADGGKTDALKDLLRAPPQSVTGRPMISEDRVNQLKGFIGHLSEEARCTVLRELVRGLELEAELHAFDLATEKKERPELLQALWAGMLGLTEFQDAEFQNLVAGLSAKDVHETVKREEWLQALREGRLAAIPQEAWQDAKFVLAAVQQNGLALQYAADALRNDQGIVLAAVQQNGMALEHAADALRNDHGIVLAAVQQNGMALEHAADALRNDHGIVLAAVQQNGLALEHAAAALRADSDIVVAAVQQNGLALQYAADALRNDHGIVLAAVQQNGLALQYAAAALRADRDIVMAAVRQNGLALLYAEDALREDRNYMLQVVQLNPEALRYAEEALRADRDIVLAAVQRDGWALQYAAEALRADGDFMLEVVQLNPKALRWAADALREDRNFMLDAVRANRGGFRHGFNPVPVLRFAADALLGDRNFMLEAVQLNPDSLMDAPYALREDRNFMLEVVQLNPKALRWAADALREDRNFMLEVVQLNPEALKYATEELREDPEFGLQLMWLQGVLGKLKYAYYRALGLLRMLRR